MLEVKNLSCGYKDKIILEDVSFKLESGDIVCVLGSNGSGKSTLIKSVVGLIEPYKGEILINSEDIKEWSWKRRARVISYIPQTFSSTFHYKAIDIVLMGRTAYLNFTSSPSKKDEKIAEKAMERLGISHLKDKIYSQLSGGERQLVKIAQALAQQSRIIVMDEPTNNLDFGNQIVLLDYIKKCADLGLTIIMVTHFPEHAFLYGTKALLVKNNKVVEIDKPNKNLTEQDLQTLYDVKIKVVELDVEDKTMKMCVPMF